MTKPKAAARSPEYLAYVRSKPCWVCQNAPSEPHHTQRGGTGLKGSDFSVVPLCRACHGEVHQIGRNTFENKYDIHLNDAVVKYLVLWVESLPMPMP